MNDRTVILGADDTEGLGCLTPEVGDRKRVTKKAGSQKIQSRVNKGISELQDGRKTTATPVPDIL